MVLLEVLEVELDLAQSGILLLLLQPMDLMERLVLLVENGHLLVEILLMGLLHYI